MMMGSFEFHSAIDCIVAVCLLFLEVLQPSVGGDGCSLDTFSSVLRIECCPFGGRGQKGADHLHGF